MAMLNSTELSGTRLLREIDGEAGSLEDVSHVPWFSGYCGENIHTLSIRKLAFLLNVYLS